MAVLRSHKFIFHTHMPSKLMIPQMSALLNLVMLITDSALFSLLSLAFYDCVWILEIHTKKPVTFYALHHHEAVTFQSVTRSFTDQNVEH